MKEFAQLYAALDETTSTLEKVAALVAYFRQASPEDAAWAVYFLSGRKPRQAIAATRLRQWAGEMAGFSDWLVEECYDVVGDAAETIALLLPPPVEQPTRPLSSWIEDRLLPLKSKTEVDQKATVLAAWAELTSLERFVWNKLMTGGFRVGVSQLLVTRALAEVAGIPKEVIAHRLMGDWQPTGAFFTSLLAEESATSDVSRPYPFFLAYPLEQDLAALGDPAEWQAEWKWDGIRAQLIRRQGETFIWSRGEELVTSRYPELVAASHHLPEGTVLDGELLPWKDGQVLPFAQLQRRIGRKTIGKKLLAEVPVILKAYDLLEHAGQDLREAPLCQRRSRLEEVILSANDSRLQVSPRLSFTDWQDLQGLRTSSRDHAVEGLMLKRLESPYRVGRTRGDWWKWKVEPLRIDAVLVYAQKGHGRRASLYTDYTFAVWDQGVLVPIAKAYSGLTDAEIRAVDAFIRANTLERFGPVRTVKPELVFELGFEGIQRSTRHKSGLAVRFPRMLRWRQDKPAAEADSLENVRRMLVGEAP